MKRPDITVFHCINKTSRADKEKRTRRKRELYKQQNDDHPSAYTNRISNRRAKFVSFFRDKFGFTFYVRKLDKLRGGTGCCSPPISFVFDFTKNETEDVKMKDDKNAIAFQGKVYPVNKELHDAYCKGQRKERYFTIDLKVERIIIDNEKESTMFIPSREDSLDRLIDENQEQFAADIESVEDAAIQGVLKDRLHKSIAQLSADEQRLINALFFEGHTERSWSALTGLPQKTINNRKRKILNKLKNLIGI